ncbi:hypothetical protein BGZ49_007703 [Haplosporangium sp. Z 27]|nr:hypothetical protein BGZ49_007703 [Haplosporangium sp. Z 27]
MYEDIAANPLKSKLPTSRVNIEDRTTNETWCDDDDDDVRQGAGASATRGQMPMTVYRFISRSHFNLIVLTCHTIPLHFRKIYLSIIDGSDYVGREVEFYTHGLTHSFKDTRSYYEANSIESLGEVKMVIIGGTSPTIEPTSYSTFLGLQVDHQLVFSEMHDNGTKKMEDME